MFFFGSQTLSPKGTRETSSCHPSDVTRLHPGVVMTRILGGVQRFASWEGMVVFFLFF